MVLRDSIAKLLAASKNSSRDSLSSVAEAAVNAAAFGAHRGRQTERLAIGWLTARGDRVFLTRFETPFAEIDILALKPSGSILVCEVKSSFWPDEMGLGLGENQKRRLAKAAFWISSETSRDVEISLIGPMPRRMRNPKNSTQGGQFLEVPIF